MAESENLIDLTESDGMDSDDLVVDREKEALLSSLKSRIDDLFQVTVQLGSVIQDTDGDLAGDKQWITVSGEAEDRKMAKDYICALCNPAEIFHFQYPTELDILVSDPKVHAHIEKRSQAVLEYKGPGEVLIMGINTVSVTLALSALEDLINQHIEEEEEAFKPDQKSPMSNQASLLLNQELRRLTAMDDGVVILDEDYTAANDAVKRTILGCLVGDQVTEVKFRDSSADKGSSRRMDWQNGENHADLTGVKQCAQNSTDDTPVKGRFDDASRGGHQTIGHAIDKFRDMHMRTDGTSETTISDKSGYSSSDSITLTLSEKSLIDSQETLTNLAVHRGYSVEEVDEVFKEHGHSLKMSDLLRFLKRNRRGSSSAALSPVEAVGFPSKLPSPPLISAQMGISGAAWDGRAGGGSDGSSPAGAADAEHLKQYFRQLNKDFSEEDNCVDITELKRRNENRQKMLKEAFENKSRTENGSAAGSGHKSKRTKGGGKKNGTAGAATLSHNREADSPSRSRSLKKAKVHHRSPSPDRNSSLHTQDGRTGPAAAQSGGASSGNQEAVNQQQIFTQMSTQQQGQLVPQAPLQLQQAPVRMQQQQQAMPQGTQQRLTQVSANARLTGPAQAGVPNHRQYRLPPRDRVPRVPASTAAGGPGLIEPPPSRKNLRYIVIDGSNLAMTHGNGQVFSCKGIQIAIDHFLKRGHQQVTVFVPQWRLRAHQPDRPIRDQHLLDELRIRGYLVFTPARRVPGKNICCYDDKFVLSLAVETEGVILSNDNYRDLWDEKREWRDTIEHRLLGYSFVGDFLMVPDDPLGQAGPTLDEFLAKSTPSPEMAPMDAENRPTRSTRWDQPPQQNNFQFRRPQVPGQRPQVPWQAPDQVQGHPRPWQHGQGRGQQAPWQSQVANPRLVMDSVSQQRPRYPAQNSQPPAATQTQAEDAQSSQGQGQPTKNQGKGRGEPKTWQQLLLAVDDSSATLRPREPIDGRNVGSSSGPFNNAKTGPGSNWQNKTNPQAQKIYTDSGNATDDSSWELVPGARGRHRSGPLLNPRTANATDVMKAQLTMVFPDNKEQIDRVLREHPSTTNIERLSNLLLNCIDGD